VPENTGGYALIEILYNMLPSLSGHGLQLIEALDCRFDRGFEPAH